MSIPWEVALAVKGLMWQGEVPLQKIRLENNISPRKTAEFDHEAWRTLVQGPYEQIGPLSYQHLQI